jgi:hypothetical protein
MATTGWMMKGRGYGFCNCDFGCGCNFGGFPNSKDGSCRSLVGVAIDSGKCGDVDLSGVKCAAILDWPKAIHQGNGRCVFEVDPATTDEQIESLGQIFTGKLGGMPWELLGPTFEVRGLAKAKISIEGKGVKSVFKAEGVGEGHRRHLQEPGHRRRASRQCRPSRRLLWPGDLPSQVVRCRNHGLAGGALIVRAAIEIGLFPQATCMPYLGTTTDHQK